MELSPVSIDPSYRSKWDAEGELHSPQRTPPRNSNIIGDMSGPCALPLVKGIHEDLHNISSSTLADLIRGDFNEQVSKFLIVDCRYPYEFEGGHIFGAVNLYTEGLIEDFFTTAQHGTLGEHSASNRVVIIFHCEFSQQRGPTMMRYFRHIDRIRNLERFPKLNFPEMYILDGGYSKFYEAFCNFCSRQDYIQMNDPRYEKELDNYFVNKKKYFCRSKGKRRVTGNGHCRCLNF